MKQISLEIIEKDLISILPKKDKSLIEKYFKLMKEINIDLELYPKVNSQKKIEMLESGNVYLNEKIEELKKDEIRSENE